MDSKSAPRICGSELPELESNQRMQESKSCALPLGDRALLRRNFSRRFCDIL